MPKQIPRLPQNEGEGRNDAFYQLKGEKKKKDKAVLMAKRPRKLSQTLAQTLEGLRMESQDAKAIPNYRLKKSKSSEWAQKSRDL